MGTIKTQKNQSEYIGVTFEKKIQKWKSTVTDKGKAYPCGFHDTDRQAAMARDLAIIKFKLNKPLQILSPK
jgi:hypothetical protein